MVLKRLFQERLVLSEVVKGVYQEIPPYLFVMLHLFRSLLPTVMKVVLLLGVAIVVAQGQVQDNCDSTLFKHCNVALGSFWNIDSSNIWNDLDQLDRALMSLMRPPYGIDNYVNICNGFSNFYSCLGPQNIQYCLGLIGLVGMGKSPQDAYSYEGFLADWRFKCGAGFFAVYENVTLTACTQSTYVNYNDVIKSTIDAYKRNVTADTDNACTYAQNLMDSFGSVYRNGACRGPTANDAQWYGCSSAREYTNAQFKHCQHSTTCQTRLFNP
ncbi:hypothetical protein V3C99_008299 [Haemonchus contortus]